MLIDITNLTMPEPKAIALLKAEVRRLGAVITASEPILTDEERAAVLYFSKWGAWKSAEPHAKALLALLERTK